MKKRYSTESKFRKVTITVLDPDNAKINKTAAFKNNVPFINSFQKSMVYKLTMQKIYMF